MTEALNLKRRLFLTETDELVPIVKLFNGDGEETGREDEARAAVAGPTAAGKWIAIDLTKFETATVQ